MIEKNTVFILGAGASVPYGFPTGVQLTNRILNFNWDNIFNANKIKNNEIWNGILSFCDRVDLISFIQTLRKYPDSSIDDLLKNNNKYKQPGKVLISLALIECENRNNLFKNIEDHWYSYLFKQLEVPTIDKFSRNNVNIITFNYDRSLERWFYESIMDFYDLNAINCIELCKRTINPLHLHGILGELDEFSTTESRVYSDYFEIDKLDQYVNWIRTPYDIDGKDPVFNSAHKILNESDNICFLGFRYAETNLKRLIKGVNFSKKNVFGTAYDLVPAEIKKIENIFSSHPGSPMNLYFDESGKMKCTEFLRNYSDKLF